MDPCPKINTKPLLQFVYSFSGNKIWRCDDFTVYPPEYFCPLEYNTNKMNITANTLSIHLYNASWLSILDKLINRIEGSNKHGISLKIRRLVSFPFRVINKFKKMDLVIQ